MAASLAAGAGAAAAVAVAWLPSLQVHPPISVHPELVVAATAGASIGAGIAITVAALLAPPIAGSLRAAVIWTWLLALACSIAGMLTHEEHPPPRVGALDAPSLVPPGWWSGPAATIGAAVLLGLAVAATARWAGAHRLQVAVSGLAGPGAIAIAYLVTGAGRIPLLAAGAGLLTSTVVALIGRRAGRGHETTAVGTTAVGAKSAAPDKSSEPHQSFEPAKGPARGNGVRGAHTGRAAVTGHPPVTGHAPAGHAPDPPATAPHTPKAPASIPTLATAPAPVAAPMIGRPPRSADGDYTEWLGAGPIPVDR